VQEKLLAPLVNPLSTINIMNFQLLDIQSSLPVIVQANFLLNYFNSSSRIKQLIVLKCLYHR
jgi:hypothetical protein